LAVAHLPDYRRGLDQRQQPDGSPAVLHGADDTTLFLVFQVITILIFLFASWAMGRIEGRTIAEYGLPWRRMFLRNFWNGVLLGFASITGVLVAMRAAGVFHGPSARWEAIYNFPVLIRLGCFYFKSLSSSRRLHDHPSSSGLGDAGPSSRVQIARNSDAETSLCGNRLWVVPLSDPHGYRIEFSSPTDAPEESELEE
jgi:hypothetical protein